jgi:ribosomal subunit interface protein
MNILIQSPDVNPRETLKDLIDEKVGKLEQFSDRIMEARVLLKLDSSDTRENKVCEVKLIIPGNDLFAKRNAESFEEALSGVVEALRKQLISWRDKVKQL